MTVAMFVAATVIGCSPVYVDWDHHSLRTKPEVHTSAAVSTPRTDTAYASHKTPSHPRKHKQTTNSTEEPQAPETPDVDQMSIQPGSAASSDSSGSTISMVSPGDTSAAAEKSLDTTSQRLGRFQRNRLNGSALASYDQANAFLNQGKQALAEKDYVAASGFAQKASVLADKLQTNPAGH
jgi:hypothetical protein